MKTHPAFGILKKSGIKLSIGISKGPLLLYELKKIGERKLIEIFSFLLENKINTLKGLVDVIDIKAGKDVAKWFNDSL